MALPLTVKDLRVETARGRVLLDVPALQVEPGMLVGIRGPSGAGKSTLLFALAGLLDRCSGSVFWAETDLIAKSNEERARFRADHIGIVFQDFLLFDELGALANAKLAAMFRPGSERKAYAERAQAALKDLGLGDLARPVASFSGGERQRVSIARALVGDGPVLLADEPTASLDRANADRLIEDLANLARKSGKTLIAVSHDNALLSRMDRLITIEDGRISAGDAI